MNRAIGLIGTFAVSCGAVVDEVEQSETERLRTIRLSRMFEQAQMHKQASLATKSGNEMELSSLFDSLNLQPGTKGKQTVSYKKSKFNYVPEVIVQMTPAVKAAARPTGTIIGPTDYLMK